MEPTGFDCHGPDHAGLFVTGGIGFRSQPCAPDSSSRPVIKRGTLRLEPNCVARYRTSNDCIEKTKGSRTNGFETDHSIRTVGNFAWIEKRPDMRTESSDPVTTKDVLYALGQYRIESNESDRQTATKLGVNCLTLKDWLRGVDPPQRCLLARLA